MSAPQIPPDIALLTGPQLVGIVINTALLGVLSVQVYFYSLAFNDSRSIKIFVYTLYVCEVVQSMLNVHDGFKILASGWGNVSELENVQLLWFDTTIMGGMIAASVQCFYAWRIYVIGRSPYVPVLIALIAVMQCVGGITAGIKLTTDPNIVTLQQVTFVPVTIWLAGCASADILIAASMVYLLSRNRKEVPFSNAILNRIITLTVETGMVTAGIAVVDLALFLRFQHNNLHMAPAFTLAKLYSNSLLVLFNNRMRVVDGTVYSQNGRGCATCGNAGNGTTRVSVSGMLSRRSRAPPRLNEHGGIMMYSESVTVTDRDSLSHEMPMIKLAAQSDHKAPELKSNMSSYMSSYDQEQTV